MYLCRQLRLLYKRTSRHCKKASELFDEVHILVATNCEKQRTFPEDKMRELIEEAIADDGIANCYVRVYSGIVAEYANEHGIKYLVRGLRNVVDFQYEENLASINRLICSELETVYLRSDNAAISSSVVRGLFWYNRRNGGVLVCTRLRYLV